jgi:hypothetical protein
MWGVGIGVARHAAESGDLDNLFSEQHVNQPEAASNQPRVPEQVMDLLGRGAGGDVKVLGFATQEQVAHAAANKIGVVAPSGSAGAALSSRIR